MRLFRDNVVNSRPGGQVQHQLDNCLPMLRRWAALNDGPMPSSWSDFSRDNATIALEIEQRDPELVSLLTGKAPASLRLAALTGELADAAPTADERAQASAAAEVESILAATNGNPYGSAGHYDEQGKFHPGRGGDLTQAMLLEMRDPALAARLKAEAMPAAPQTGLSAEQASFVNSEIAKARLASISQTGES